MIDPMRDKGLVLMYEGYMNHQWQLHVHNDPIAAQAIKNMIRSATMWPFDRDRAKEIVMATNPFVQGDSSHREEGKSNWLMIEFWTDDQSKILEAAIVLADLCQYELEIV